MPRGQVFPGRSGGGASKLDQSLTSTKNVGGIANGQTFPAGTSVTDILREMLIEEEAPQYLAPTLSLSASYANNALIEVGTTLNVALTAAYNQRDGGAADQVVFKADGAAVHTDTQSPFTHSYTHQLIASLALLATVNYQQGPVQSTNLGNPSPNGQIPAGSKNSNTVTLRAVRRAFWGTGQPSGSSSEIRSLGNSLLNPANGGRFTINIPAGAASVAFAYPASLRAVSSVLYAEGLNADVKGNFAETSVSVEGAEGFTGVAYRVYRFVPAEPFSQAATYNVTI